MEAVDTMSIVPLRRRLEELEARRAPAAVEPKAEPLTKLLQVLIAHHLGGAEPDDSIASALARGLGYESSHRLMEALRADPGARASEDLDTRWREANRRLLALKGATSDCGAQDFCDALEALFYSMPERLQQHPYLDEFDAAAFFRAA